jgi:predicted benzoate:H+ symporter BenE
LPLSGPIHLPALIHFAFALARLRRIVPPVIGALITGGLAIALFGTFDLREPVVFGLARPNLYWPEFSWAAMVELVLPLTITVLALRVLERAFGVSFKGGFTLGATVCFLVTVANVPILSIGAPFWAVLIGLAVSWALERSDFEGLQAAPPPA